MVDLKILLTKILTSLKSPVKVQSTTLPSATYNANSYTWVYSNDWHAASIAGYTAIGALQATPNNSASLICQVTLNQSLYGDRFIGFVRNITSSNATDTIQIPILYIRSDLL